MSLMTANPIIDLASEQQPSIYYLDDGTAIFKVVSDPNGLIIANAGSLALQNNGDAWIKSGNNDSVWTLIGGGGGASPGAPDHSVQYNDGGVFAGDAGFIYDPTALTNLLLEPQVSNGLAIFENGTTPSASAWSPFLLQLHSGNTAFSMVFTNDADSYQWAMYRSGFNLNIESTGPGRGYMSWYLQPEANNGSHYVFPNGYLFSSVSATYYGGVGEIAADTFALMLSTGTVSAGTRVYPVTWKANAVGINNTSPVSALDIIPFTQSQVHGLAVTRIYNSTIGNIFPDAINSAITLNSGAVVNSVLSGVYSYVGVNAGSANYINGLSTYQEYYGGTINTDVTGVNNYTYIENGSMPAVYGLRSRIETYAPASITASYNLYLDNAANNALDAWAIYSTGSLKSYIGGSVGINAITALATFHVNALNNTSVAGLFIANAPTVDVFQVSIDNGSSVAWGINNAGFSYARKGAIIGGEASAAELRFLEPSGSGSNYTGFKAPVLAGNIIYTLPDTAGAPGDALIINASNVLSWNATSGFGQSPGLPDTSIQFNNAGVFDGDATFFFDDANKVVNAGAFEITQFDINISGFTLNVNAGTLVEPFVIKDSGGNIRGGWSFAGAFFYRGFTSAPTNSLANDGKLFYDITGGVTNQQLLLSKNTGTYNPVIVANQASYVTKRLGVWSSTNWELEDSPGFEYQAGASPNVRILAQNNAHSALLLSSNSGTVSAPILDVRVNLVADTGLEVDGDTTPGNTRLLIYDVDNATLERVSVGPADSGDIGFKVLRIPN